MILRASKNAQTRGTIQSGPSSLGERWVREYFNSPTAFLPLIDIPIAISDVVFRVDFFLYAPSL